MGSVESSLKKEIKEKSGKAKKIAKKVVKGEGDNNSMYS